MSYLTVWMCSMVLKPKWRYCVRFPSSVCRAEFHLQPIHLTKAGQYKSDSFPRHRFAVDYCGPPRSCPASTLPSQVLRGRLQGDIRSLHSLHIDIITSTVLNLSAFGRESADQRRRGCLKTFDGTNDTPRHTRTKENCSTEI